MGTSKAMLPFGPETMLQRVVRLLAPVVTPLAVVAARDQELPALPECVVLTRDDNADRGPLEGIHAGWRALPASTEVAYVTSCDVPMLRPAFVTRMIGLLGNYEIAAVQADGFLHPLAAVYRRTTLPSIARMLANNELRVTALLERLLTRRVQPEEVADVDPELLSLRNLNTPEDYQAALALKMET